MERKAYFEGIVRMWWLIVTLLAISLWIGTSVGNGQTSKYVASTSIRINSGLLALAAVPSSVVQFSEPLSYMPEVTSPVILNYIAKHYPRLVGHLKENIAISGDSNNQLLLIKVTDIAPASAADIANFLAQQFVKTQTGNLKRQLDYYEHWLQQQIPALTNQINTLNTSIQTATQNLTTPADRTQLQSISQQESQAFQDEHSLYNYQQALAALQRTRPLFDNAYTIIQSATSSGAPQTYPYPTGYFQAGALAIGLFIALSLIVTIEYFLPFVRHKGELERVVGLPALAEMPKIYSFDLKRLLQLRPPLFGRRMKKFGLLCATIGAPAIKEKGRTILITNAHKKRDFAAPLATFLAHNGHRTLLVDADLQHPHLHTQIQLTGVLELTARNGMPIPFVKKTLHTHLFLLATSQEDLSNAALLELLPELACLFDIIVIDAPPLYRSETHLLATKVTQTLLLVKKRRDTLKRLKIAYKQCQDLKVHVQGLLLG